MLPEALMAGVHKLDEAFLRFEAALRNVETAVSRTAEGHSRMAELESEAETLRQDKTRLALELDLVRSKATELVDTSKNAAGKIDAAMSRIRAVLHSNTPE
jgi:predicted  nucleic acid-binding Zn-ribbon protein